MTLQINPEHIQLESKVGLDLETTGLRPWADRIRLIIISTSENIYVIDPEKYEEDFLITLFANVAQCEQVVAHNAKFDCGFIYGHYGILLRNWFCVQIGSQIITNGKLEYQGRHNLAEVLSRYLNIEHSFSSKKKSFQKSFAYFEGELTERQLQYAADDVRYLIPLAERQIKIIDGLSMRAIRKLEMDLIPILAKMEVEGCLIDQENWRKLIKDEWEPELRRLEELLDEEVLRLAPETKQRRRETTVQFDLFGGTVVTEVSTGGLNYGSSDQVLDFIRSIGEEVPTIKVDNNGRNTNISTRSRDSRDRVHSVQGQIFIDDIDDDREFWGAPTDDGWDGEQARETKESLEEGVLQTYINERPNSRLKRFIELLLEYRVAAKRVSTYGEKFLSKLDFDSRIHTGYTQTFTATGRLSSKAPNLQNIPAPEKGKPHTDIRRFFIARPGYRFITCDMSGAEIRIAADYSGEPLLIASILEGADMHSDLATVSFSIILGQEFKVSKSTQPVYINGVELIPEELRNVHKAVVFAKFYKGGAARVYGVLAKYINMFHPPENRMAIAQEISSALDERLPKLSAFLDKQIKEAQRTGMLRSDKLGRIRHFTKDVYGEAANYPIQGTNANALKMAMITIHDWLEEEGLDARLVLNVHDEVVVEAREDIAEMVGEKVQEIMANSLGYFLKVVPGGAEYKISNHWQK